MNNNQSPARVDSPDQSPSWGILLPTDWWRIPLADQVERTRSVKSLINDRFRNTDAPPALKRRAQADLLNVTAQAAQGGGQLMALAMINLNGVVVTVTLLITQLFTVGVAGEGLTAFQEQLATRLPPGVTALTTEIDAGHVVRIISSREAITSPEEVPGMTSLPELKATYWVTLNLAAPVILNFVFTSPFTPLRDGLLELFDSIVGSLHLPSNVDEQEQ